MRKRIGLIFGGLSAEHEISLKSASAVFKNMDRERFDIVPIYIDRNGMWSIQDLTCFENGVDPKVMTNTFLPWGSTIGERLACDIYFPVLHGPNGEDGKVQSLIELAGKPLVGANSLGSALAMDKTVAKVLFKEAGLNVVPSLSFNKQQPERQICDMVLEHLKLPVFIKPNALGSSVGISKAENESEIIKGIEAAFHFDNQVIIEEGLNVREIEVSIMGNDELMVSRPGELVPDNAFYDYEDKYLKGKTTFHIPAKLDPEMETQVMESTKIAFQALRLNGMARVDFFIESETDKLYINEINTIPGFTEISMFPKLWETVGIGFTDLLNRLVEFGFEAYRIKC